MENTQLVDNGNDDHAMQMGEQPLAALMRMRGVSRHDLVVAAPGVVTHKLVKRAETGRRLTIHSKEIVLAAWNRATGENRKVEDLFSY